MRSAKLGRKCCIPLFRLSVAFLTLEAKLARIVAEFLAGGQVLKAGGRAYLPRRWRVIEAGTAGAGVGARVEAGIFRGNEYEYFAATPAFAGSLRFFSDKKLAAGAGVELSYRD